jgi:chromate transport protein ChrA
MFWLWFIVAVLLLGFYVYKLGLSNIDNDEKFSMFLILVCIAIGWPVVLVSALIVGPFVGVYYLGHRKREAARAAAKDKR